MYELKKKIGKLLTSKSVGTGPSSYEKRIYRAAATQSLRNTGLDAFVHFVCVHHRLVAASSHVVIQEGRPLDTTICRRKELFIRRNSALYVVEFHQDIFRLMYTEAIDRQTKLYVQYFSYCALSFYRLGSQQDSVQQARQCTYNVTMRRIRATIVAVENQ